MTAPLQQTAREHADVTTILIAHGDDANAAIAALIAEIRRLHQQLALAEFAGSRGFSRGWQPTYDG
ncbi:Hypothetical protein NGAL_HAMBI1146_58910 [Neorhizobium galegae bv. officinalis]|nr:Hypothetical protein NGAL_HAMBI1146_58910 [Neorhizobium galegae bv. officinalis]